MGVVVGLVLGAGLVSVWASFWAPPRRGPRRGDLRRARSRDLLVQAGFPEISPGTLTAATVGLAVLTALVVFALTRSPTIAVCFGVLAGLAPRAVVRSRARKRSMVLRDLWPDVVDHLVSAVRAGLSIPEALGQIGQRGPAELRAPFAAFAQDYRAGGRLSDALDALKDRLADPVGDRIVESLRITSDVGGADLGRLLRTLSAFLREDARTRGELEARQSWTVNGARVAVAGPWVVLGLLATRPETAAAYDSVAGALVLAGGAVCSLVAYRAMIRIGRLPSEERVLR
ncbi:type II secretion system F family protein [Cellulomonas sp. PhB143]|uniref:type II secretion system F family protein n=1 Tax=Cellulomonas sp. PhB143 TaxID=2485186 RepID=UPI000F4A7524|nr:type II secretion system F family protein [Cellulomonas sp. PhB143]ROS76985.1 tight adherence protein B [Cellulomonas sp. PhB143]